MVCKQENEAGQLLAPLTSVMERVALLTGVSESTLYRLQRDDQPSERKEYPRRIVLDEFDKNVVRRTVGDLVRTRNIIPTLADIRAELLLRIGYRGSRETLRKNMTELGFKWRATLSNRDLLMERTDVVAARIHFLRQMRQYREENRPIVYTDETFVHSSHSARRSWQSDEFAIKVPFSKGTRHIVVHAGSDAGFIPGAELIFKAKTTTGDYHDEMSSANFMRWLESQLIPNLPRNAVLVVDNAPYHTVQEDKRPTMANNKAYIKDWLQRNNVQYTENMLKAELLHLCKLSRPRPRYILESTLEQHGFACLRLPPYHAKLNPIELIWSQVKGNIAMRNTTFKSTIVIQLIQDAFEKVKPSDWSACCRHVRGIEDAYWANDIAKDSASDRVVFTVCSSDEDTDSASDFENFSDTDTADETG